MSVDRISDERARFEAWLSTVPNDQPSITVEQAGGQEGDDRYMSPTTALAWSAWKAARLAGVGKPMAHAWFHRGEVNFDDEPDLGEFDDGKGTPIPLYTAALPLLECGKGEAVAWMIRNKGDGELHWNEELCVFADAASAGEMAECLNDGDPPIWEALPLYTAPQPAAQQPAGDGWKLVPIEPHGQMARAARLQYEDDDDEGVVDWFAVVAAAIAAAPESKP